jgi:hypothetical protein
MARCINCKRDVGCACQLLEKKYCSQKCKDEYLSKNDTDNLLLELPITEVPVRQSGQEDIPTDEEQLVQYNLQHRHLFQQEVAESVSMDEGSTIWQNPKSMFHL